MEASHQSFNKSSSEYTPDKDCRTTAVTIVLIEYIYIYLVWIYRLITHFDKKSPYQIQFPLDFNVNLCYIIKI